MIFKIVVFSCAVVSDNGNAFPALNVKIHILKEHGAVKALRQTA